MGDEDGVGAADLLIDYEGDPRLEFMFDYLFKTFKLKAEKWTKLTSTDEYTELLLKFFITPKIRALVIAMTPAGQLVPYLNFPPNLKSKASYFLRMRKAMVTKENFRSVLRCGDLAHDTLEEMTVLFDQAWFPFLSNVKNHKGWPTVISEDVIRHVRDLKSILYESKGKAIGDILLPMPAGVERVHEAEMEIIESEGDVVDIHLKSSIEGIVIKWVKQINETLTEDAGDLFKNGQKPTPNEEFEFWTSRVKKLECIYDQLRDPRVKKMASILELTESAYYQSFRTMFQNVVAALAEARDINLFMKPLIKWVRVIESGEFDDAPTFYDPLFETICLVWSHSRYYCSSTKLINLFRQINFLLIDLAEKFLDPGSLFQGEFQELLVQLRKVMRGLEVYQEKFEEYRDKVTTYFPENITPVDWNFHPELIFRDVIRFLDRLAIIEELFIAGDDYSKLEKVEIGGLGGKLLSVRVAVIMEAFAEAFLPLQNIQYNPLDPDDPSFMRDYAIFKARITDFDNLLGTIFVKSYEEASNLEGIFKLLNIIGHFAERPIIRDMLLPKLACIIDLYEKEVDATKVAFDDGIKFRMAMGRMILDPYNPPVAGTLLWVQKLQRRVTIPSESIEACELDLLNNNRAYFVMEKRDEMLELLSAFDLHEYSRWKEDSPHVVEKILPMKLLIRDEETRLLSLNFCREFQTILREVRYLKTAEKTDIPQEVDELFERELDIRNWIFHLHRIIYWYNQVLMRSHPSEFDLIYEELDGIDKLIDTMQETKTWRDLDAFVNIKEIHDALESLHHRMELAQKNILRITELMLPWSKNPLYERKDVKPECPIVLDDRKERVEKRFNEIRDVGIIIRKIMKKNYKLFLNLEMTDSDSDKVDEPKKSIIDFIGEETPEGAVDEEKVSEESSSEYETDSGSSEESSSGSDKEAKAKASTASQPPEKKSATPVAPVVSTVTIDEEEEGEMGEEGDEGDEGEGAQGEEGAGGEDEEGEGGYEKKGTKDQETGEVEEVGEDDEEDLEEGVDFSSEWEGEGEGEEVEEEEKKKKKRRKKKKKKSSASVSEAGPTMQEREGWDDYLLMEGEFGEEGGEEEEALELSPSEEARLAERRLVFNEKWKEYETYVDSVVSQGLQSAISCSFGVFIVGTDEDLTSSPLFNVSFELHEPDMVFIPSMNIKDHDGFYSLVESLLNDILDMAKLIPRVRKSPEVEFYLRLQIMAAEEEEEMPINFSQASGLRLKGGADNENAEGGEKQEGGDDTKKEGEEAGEYDYAEEFGEEDDEGEMDFASLGILEAPPPDHYMEDVEANATLCDVATEILCRTQIACTQAVDYASKFLEYSYLWLDNRDDFLEQFLKYGHGLSPEEEEMVGIVYEDGSSPLKEGKPTLTNFKEQIDYYDDLYKSLEAIETENVVNNWLRIQLKLFKKGLLNAVKKWSDILKDYLIHDVEDKLSELDAFIIEARRVFAHDPETMDYDALIDTIRILFKIKERTPTTDEMFEPIKNTIELLKSYGVEFPPEVHLLLQELPDKWLHCKKIAVTAKQAVAPLMAAEMATIRKRITFFDLRQQQYRESFKKLPIFSYPCSNPYEILDKVNDVLRKMEIQLEKLQDQSGMFDIPLPDFKAVKLCRKEAKQLKMLWDYAQVIESNIDEWKKTKWKSIDVDSMEQECKNFGKLLRGLDKELRQWATYEQLEAAIKNLLTSLRAVTELQNPAIRPRHWKQLMQATKVDLQMDDETTLADLLDLNLHRYEDEVRNIVEQSEKEMSMEKILKELSATWERMEFKYDTHARTGCLILQSDEELIETLEENQVQLQNMMSSKFIGHFLEEVSVWQQKLSTADMVINLWFDVQRSWSHLESVFVGSEDIRSQLPTDSKRFERLNAEFQGLLKYINTTPNVVQGTARPGLYEQLEEIQDGLTQCEKALTEYLETKRLAFPRFYFVSSADLLDILSNGNQPELVAKHLSKLYDSLGKLGFSQKDGKNTKTAITMIAKDGEHVKMKKVCDCTGKVESWLNKLTDCMRETMRWFFGEGVVSYDEKPREQWVFDYPAQVSLCGTQIWWTTEVGLAFARLEEGYENALKDYQKKQINQLNNLIALLCGELTSEERQKICTICTIDVHSRDVVAKLIAVKVETVGCFQWQTQLRHRWDDSTTHCYCNICDAEFRYAYEYLGCTPRLVITPLTDRCYITLTQSLHLIMGGAPAGPAGTGKTETTKDLGRAMGIMVYVFNCSEQMDYKSCGNIYKGLAQTGAWGCFDEFNRISVEVLSVVAVQVKSILDAIKDKKTRFNFVGEVISLIPTVGMFITMNPGYAGRTELPENLKALFRPCAMVVPDFELICEIMLVAEGFQSARLLARKFITLYTLCKELLSKQDHYDWGLRAIKSVLVVAGSLKRGDRERPEDQVLMRALRDFNIPKIVTDDVPVFMGLIGDLFPALDVPRKRDINFETMVKKSVTDLGLQPEDSFVLKIVQLEELLAVRHSVFLVGFAGTGKSMVWRSLFRTYQNQKRKPAYNDLNPKAVTNDELFGIINPATREWKDGLFSIIMRDQTNLSGDGPKWILLDGDIDPMWIESLNTLMDDNKVLTLASNERIALTPRMRLLFEIANLKTATPATVSRAGILYINPQDLGWNPFVTSWLDKRSSQSEKANLLILFDKYVPLCLDVIQKRMKKITPIPEVAHLEMLCNLLECFLTPQNVPFECPKEWYEIYFVFACFWAFGSTMFQDQVVDYRNEFTKWWLNEFKGVKVPTTGTVFDYVVDPDTKKFIPWRTLVTKYELDYDIPLQSTLVDTSETTRLRYFMDLFMTKKLPLMLVGPSGSGKSVVIAAKLNSLNESYSVTNVPFNFYTTSEMLQRVLEKPLEKKAGRKYGPPGSKTMVYFVDDMNMPEVDTYGTVQPHTLIRQYMDYEHWYDRTKMTLKEIDNCFFVSSMNPTAGSFTINPRLQRHFAVFAVSFPTGEPLYHIYHSILSQHLELPSNKIGFSVAKIAGPIVNVALALHQKVSAVFLPTAVKFHYVFNLRDLSNVFQALLFSSPECIPNPGALIRLFFHEATRVYRDKLIDDEDAEEFNKVAAEAAKVFEEISADELFKAPLIFCHFAEGLGEGKYLPIKSWQHLSLLLNEAMSQYNDMVGAMNLVLFENAMEHVCRINRILESPRGNALLIGVGGSGKQSLSRLSSFISSLEVFQIQLTQAYGISNLREELNTLYLKSGLKNAGITFLMSDAQVADEKFLVIINDLLASGEIPDLFADDEIDNIINGIRNEVKSMGIPDTNDNCWKFFINRVRSNMKVVLCFSPVGSTLRDRARKFPAVVNCTSLDWFHSWPQSALESVSNRFLQEISALPEKLRRPVSLFMAFVHTSVNAMSELYLQNEKRYNYTTPKTFLEQINLYGKLLTDKTGELQTRIDNLENGLLKLASTEEQVDGLKDKLAEQEVVVGEKNAAADKLIQVVGKETEIVSKEKEYVAEEEEKVRVIEIDVSAKQKICEADLKKAEPALIAAREALNTLNKNNLTELKSFGAPPDAVVNVCAAVLVLFSKKGKIPKDRSWKECKVMMAKVDAFLDNLINYNKENIPADVVKETKKYLANPEFEPENIMGKSLAAAGLCAWVINIIKFYEVYEVVEPKRKALEQANNDLSAAREKLQTLTARINELEEKLGILTAEFEEAIAQKVKCQQEADATALTIDLAHRLVSGLASESVRWKESVANLKLAGEFLPGDVLLICAFISYVGCFTRQYRIDLMDRKWLVYLQELPEPIPRTEDLDPLMLLTDDAQIAKWNNEGLPTDRMSAENATILTNSARWPLMIDPQLQGIKWIKQRYAKNLKIVRLGTKGYLDVIVRSLSEGNTVLIENIGESVDAVLDPILGRNLVKRGRAIKLGDREIDYNPEFRLILHTKLANPHYKPEMQAQTTLINFTVTRDGLEEQLMGDVVKSERPDLEQQKADLTKQQNNFKITIAELESDLLARLAAAGDDILSDTALVENLERTKKTAAEIKIKVVEAKETGIQIDAAREEYRLAAARGSLLYFILNELHRVNPIYQFSLKAFNVVFKYALAHAVPDEKIQIRLSNLLDSISFNVFMYTSRGLFERDKLTFMSQMAISILVHAKEIPPRQLDFLMRFPITPNQVSPVDFLTDNNWGGIKTLCNYDEFRNLDRDIEGSAKTWKKYVDAECPEKDKFPQEWKNKSAFEKLCMLRALRADRMTYAMRIFIEEKLGKKYVDARTPEFSKSYQETSSSTPTFFILSPGVDPLKDVEKMGKRLGFSMDKKNFHNVSLGQGQEVVAEDSMDIASKKGHWVILQNIHLVAKWLSTLEKKMELCAQKAHKKFRLYLSAEPAGTPSAHIIPQGILESSIKITNEAPTGMLANIHKALDNFTQETLEMCSKEAEFKAILFSLCYFHAVVAERRKFGPQGWNRVYPFNAGDLTISANVLYNYLENASQVPWEDLRYLFGEIMYGGHITDDWDRRLCRTYLAEYMSPVLLEGDLELAPGFPAPPNMDYFGYHAYIDGQLPPESPYLYGLHPNAEIGFLTDIAEALFRTLFELQPRDAGAGDAGGESKDDKVRSILDELLDRIPELFSVADIMARTEDRNPYIIVSFQECERMNILVGELKRTLNELNLGLRGELTITPEMEALQECLFTDSVPGSWTVKAYPSMYTLGPWFADLQNRYKELESWTGDFNLPSSVWLGGFFNPQSFLTAIMQSTARKNEWPLDKMCLSCDVTKKAREEITAAPREGSYINGLYMEGARWDSKIGSIGDSKLKELFPLMPVVFIRAVTQDKQELKNMYQCPVYKTRMRGPTFVWTFNLKTKEKESKWTLAGVAILLQV